MKKALLHRLHTALDPMRRMYHYRRMLSKLLIAPGHGGSDSGSVGYGIRESDITLEYSLELLDMLGRLELPGLELATTRTIHGEENTVGMRVQKAKDFGAQLVLELHCDRSDSPKRRGLQTFYYNGNTLSQSVAAQIMRAAPERLRHVRAKGPVAPAEHTYPRALWLLEQYTSPVVLVEMGFLTSPIDNNALQSAQVRKQMCLALCCGIARWLDVRASLYA